ncbi:MAG: hypothetical protein KIS94_06020 [Chitinophagales bacterium]|nr:hypothetical protein [Chitinophagales bacterium]
MLPNKHFENDYRLKATLVFSFALLLFFMRFMNNVLVSQIGEVPFLFEQKEWTYRLFYQSSIAQWLTVHFIPAAMFDALLFFLPLVFMLTRSRLYVYGFSLIALIYFLLFNMAAGHHYHGMVGVLVMSVPFWSKNEERFNLLWQGARYYLLYIFASAALWKLLRGSAFEPEQMVNILKAQQLDVLLQQPGSLRAVIAQYLIAHPAVAHGVLVTNMLLQLSFVTGFFTKRFDVVLLVLCVVFVVANYFAMSIVSAELLILCIPLLNFKQLQRIQDVLMVKEDVAEEDIRPAVV